MDRLGHTPRLPLGWCAYTDSQGQIYYAHTSGYVRRDPPPSNPPPPPLMPAAPPRPPPLSRRRSNSYASLAQLTMSNAYQHQQRTTYSTSYSTYNKYKQYTNYSQHGNKRSFDSFQQHVSYQTRDQKSNRGYTQSKKCSRCKMELDGSRYSKKQWQMAAVWRRCIQCIKEDTKLAKLRDEFKVEPEKKRMKFGETISPEGKKNESPHLSADARINCQREVSTPQKVSPASNKAVFESGSQEQETSNPTTQTSHAKDDDLAVKCSEFVVKSSSNITGTMRNCSKCNKECTREGFSKTQWFMSSPFRSCKLCVENDRKEVAHAEAEGVEDRKWMYEDVDALRKCIVCNIELEWHKFSMRQWIMHETERKCRQCISDADHLWYL